MGNAPWTPGALSPASPSLLVDETPDSAYSEVGSAENRKGGWSAKCKECMANRRRQTHVPLGRSYGTVAALPTLDGG